MKLKKDKRGRVIIPDEYERMVINDLLPGDILLFSHNNKLTEFHGRWRKKKYGRSTIPPYHAAIVYKVDKFIPALQIPTDVYILDPEISTSLSFLREYLTKKEVRIDVVRFKATKKQRQTIQKKIKEVGSKEGLYDWRGYFAFASQLPFLGWLKIIKPSKKTYFCSDASTYVIQSVTNIKVSPRKANNTAPIDIQLYGLKHHKLYTLKRKGELL